MGNNRELLCMWSLSLFILRRCHFIQFAVSHILSRILFDTVRFSFKLCDFLDFCTSLQNIGMLAYLAYNNLCRVLGVCCFFSSFSSEFMSAIVFRVCAWKSSCEFGGNIFSRKFIHFWICIYIPLLDLIAYAFSLNTFPQKIRQVKLLNEIFNNKHTSKFVPIRGDSQFQCSMISLMT